MREFWIAVVALALAAYLVWCEGRVRDRWRVRTHEEAEREKALRQRVGVQAERTLARSGLPPFPADGSAHGEQELS
jgi:hypothetical protein